MLAQSLLFPVLALATFASAGPIAARGTDDSTKCQNNLFIVAPPKEYLYQVFCNTKFSLDSYDGLSGTVTMKHATDIVDCALQCDAFTNSLTKTSTGDNFLCHAATFQKNTSGNNCALHSKGVNDDITDIMTDGDNGSQPNFESVQVQQRKLQ